MGCWVIISSRRNWWTKIEPNMSEGVPLGLNQYMSRTRFEVILLSICYTDGENFNTMMGYYACAKWKRYGTWKLLKNLIHCGLMSWKMLLLSGSKIMLLDLCELCVDLTLLVKKGTLFVAVKIIFCGDRI